jgi:hypothetical protein
MPAERDAQSTGQYPSVSAIARAATAAALVVRAVEDDPRNHKEPIHRADVSGL